MKFQRNWLIVSAFCLAVAIVSFVWIAMHRDPIPVAVEVPRQSVGEDPPATSAQIEQIAKMQGWSLEDATLHTHVLDDLSHKKPPNESDWRKLVAASRKYPSMNFIQSLAMELPKVDTNPAHQEVAKKWCIDMMNVDPAKDQYIGLNGYYGYIHSNASQDEITTWRTKLLARGGPYPDRIALFDGRLAQRRKSAQ